ncbi:MAG: serpin family protein [Gloeocapsa sp. DLM2.Bin57]|nr:MAG: serpin family protein [Gloeocapsa sp. DLM2.Bin57]
MIKKTKPLIIFLLSLLLTIVGITVQPQPTMSETENMTATQEIVKANNSFGFDVFSLLWKYNQQENIFISPSSMSFALSMLYNGATGETAREMREVLHTRDLDLETINSQNQTIREILTNIDPQVQLAIANSLWLKEGFSFQAEFLNNNQTFYNAEISELDFSSQEAVVTINNWVNENTAGKISEIIDSIDPQEILFLINAVYFKGDWTYQFNPENTSQREFYLTDAQEVSVEMMSQMSDFAYLQNEYFQAISLPYGETENLNMYIFLPVEGSNLDEFISLLNLENWQQWLAQMRPIEISISLPKFKREYEQEMGDILRELGMQRAFSAEQADFDAMTTQPVHVSNVKHKTFIEVNEEGTEAAAVTSIGVRATSVGPIMEVNRPFFYAIGERQTGTILFMGTMLNPTVE